MKVYLESINEGDDNCNCDCDCDCDPLVSFNELTLDAAITNASIFGILDKYIRFNSD